MGHYLVFERFVWFDRQVRAGQYPNAGSLAGHFEVSLKTAQRCITHMRDRLGAPLEYSHADRGYFYYDTSFELPRFHVAQEEILAILVARRLLSHTAGGMISRAIGSFGKKLFARTGDFGLTETRLAEAFSATWTGYSPAQSAVFRQVAEALLKNRLLHFDYTSPGSGRTTTRHVEPHHLQHYMGSWILLGWCRKRSDWRKFYLARMSDLKVTAKTFTPKPARTWQNHLAGSYGIFQGGQPVQVTLRFTPFRSRWIREQLWHPDQQIREISGGGIELTFPVADFREVKMKILQFGADVQVVAPEALRQEVRQEIEKMTALYSAET